MLGSALSIEVEVEVGKAGGDWASPMAAHVLCPVPHRSPMKIACFQGSTLLDSALKSRYVAY